MKKQFLIFCVLIVIVIGIFYFNFYEKPVYSFKNSKMNYVDNGVKVRYNIDLINENIIFIVTYGVRVSLFVV